MAEVIQMAPRMPQVRRPALGDVVLFRHASGEQYPAIVWAHGRGSTHWLFVFGQTLVQVYADFGDGLEQWSYRPCEQREAA